METKKPHGFNYCIKCNVWYTERICPACSNGLSYCEKCGVWYIEKYCPVCEQYEKKRGGR